MISFICDGCHAALQIAMNRPVNSVVVHTVAQTHEFPVTQGEPES